MSRVSFGSISVDALTAPEAIDRIAVLLAEGGGTVFTPNVHHAALAERDPQFAAAYRVASLCLCDGTPLRWALSLQGRIPERIAGSSFLPRLLGEASRKCWRVAFVGGRSEVSSRLVALLQQRFPGVHPVLISEPTRRLTTELAETLAVLPQRLATARAQLVCVSLPSPLQEVWAQRVHAKLGGGVFVCTGSAIDRLVGAAPTPPTWLGAAGLEWAWRVWQEPVRLAPRYAADLRAFVPLVLRAARNRPQPK